MKPEERIEKLIKKINVTSSARMHTKTLDDALVAQEKWKNEQSANIEPNIWRIIMKNPMTKLTTAAAAILIAALGITFLNKSATPAYAVEQTIEAMKDIVTIHFFATDWSGRTLETWIKVNPHTGENDCHYLNEPERGQISISTPEITYFYHPDENKVRIVQGQALRSDIRFGRFIEDILDRVIEPENGQIQIDKTYDEDTARDLIILHAESPQYEMEAVIDPETKLPIRIDFLRCEVSGQIVKSIDEIYYNEPLPDGLFDFEIPEGAKVINESDILTVLGDRNDGISAEGLTRDEARIKLISQFWRHVLNKDWEAAHRLLPVASRRRLEDVFSKVVELISIGEPFTRDDCHLGPLTPVRLRFSDGKVLELYQITYFRRIDGKLSCVLAGEGQKAKQIDRIQY